jgi:hypothetical protein
MFVLLQEYVSAILIHIWLRCCLYESRPQNSRHRLSRKRVLGIIHLFASHVRWFWTLVLLKVVIPEVSQNHFFVF